MDGLIDATGDRQPMTVTRRKKVVLLGITSAMPVPGVIWLVAQYLTGLERLGFEAYYVEAHGLRPSPSITLGADDPHLRAAEFIAQMMGRFGLSHRWAFHARSRKRWFGMSAERLRELYQSADLIINLHGGTKPLPEHSASGRLVLLETDPVALEIQLHDQDERSLAFLQAHAACFTWGLNYGGADCRVPLGPGMVFRPSCPPVILDFWSDRSNRPGELFTTVGNWRQDGTVTYEGETYHWSKDREFLKLLDLPARAGARFELALSRRSRTEEDVALLTGRGWRVRDAMDGPADLERYRQYICGSRGEFTVAKDQNVRLRSGWFSERSACYLAAGRPVVTQDTGFGRVLPTGAGLLPFSTIDDAASSVEAIEADYDRHRRAAREIAEEYLQAEKVLSRMLRDLGL